MSFRGRRCWELSCSLDIWVAPWPRTFASALLYFRTFWFRCTLAYWCGADCFCRTSGCVLSSRCEKMQILNIDCRFSLVTNVYLVALPNDGSRKDRDE